MLLFLTLTNFFHDDNMAKDHGGNNHHDVSGTALASLVTQSVRPCCVVTLTISVPPDVYPTDADAYK